MEQKLIKLTFGAIRESDNIWVSNQSIAKALDYKK